MAAFDAIGVEAVVEGLQSFQSDLEKMNSGIAGINSNLGNLEKQSKTNTFANMASAVANVGKFALDLAKTLANVAIEAGKMAWNLGETTVKAAISFESAFAGVIKTTDGLVDSNGNLTESGAEIQQQFRDLAKEIPLSVEELLKLGEAGGQLGIAKDDLGEFTKAVAAMGVSTNISAEDAATAFAQLANIMGEEGADAFSRMGSAVVELGNNFATNEADIVNFAQRIAGAGQIAGLSTSDIFAIGAAMSSVGVQAEAGGTAVQKVLLAMNQAVATGSDQMEIFAGVAGQSTEDFAESWEKDAAGAFNDFVSGLGLLGDDALLVLQELGLQDQRLIRSFLSLANAGTLLEDTLVASNSAFIENTALSKEAGQRYATTESQLKLMENTIKDVAISVGSQLLPVLNDILIAAKPFIEEFGTWLAETLPPLVEQAGAFLQEKLLPAINDLATWLQTNIPAAIEFLKPYFDALVNFFTNEGPTAFAQTQEILGQVFAFITEKAQVVIDWFQANWPLIQETAQVLVDFWNNHIVPALDNVWAIINAAFDLFLDNILVSATLIMQVLTGDWEGAWESIKEVAANIWEGITDIWNNFLEGVLNALGSTTEEFAAIWSGVWDLLKEIVTNRAQALIDSVKNVIGGAIDAAKALLGIQSPSKVFKAFGEQTMIGFQEGLERMIPNVQATFGAAMLPQGMVGGGMVTAPQTVSNSNINIQVGPNTIGSQIDQAVFEQRVLRVVQDNI